MTPTDPVRVYQIQDQTITEATFAPGTRVPASVEEFAPGVVAPAEVQSFAAGVIAPAQVRSFAETAASPDLDTAVYDSVAYRVAEIEKHLHNSEYWFGKNAGTGFMDRDSLTSWQVIAGAINTWGAPVQIADGSLPNGAPAWAVRGDSRRFMVSNVGVADKMFIVQIWYGTGVFGTATFLTEFPFIAASNQISQGPIDVICPRIVVAGNNAWVRCKSEQAANTLDFLIGVHFYEG